MNKEQIKQEAKERVALHYKIINDHCYLYDTESHDPQCKQHALKGIQNEIDLLENLHFSARSDARTQKASISDKIAKEINHLKQVKTEIEKL